MQSKTKILYIEDNEDNMILVKRILKSEDYDLIGARSGEQGLSIIECQNLDLILLDINLPDIDGYEVVRRLRGNMKLSLASIPVIALTANAMNGDAQKALASGFDMYMTKPFNVQDLLDNIEKILGTIYEKSSRLEYTRDRTQTHNEGERNVKKHPVYRG